MHQTQVSAKAISLFLGSSLLFIGLATGTMSSPSAAEALDPQVANPAASPELTSQLAKLRQLLNANDWAAADQETRRLFSSVNGLYEVSPANVISVNLIQAIDQAWLAASNGRFGLSVQSRIWQEAIAQHPNHEAAAVDAFRDRVGWKRNPDVHPSNDFFSSDWLNEGELTYTLPAPVGHLPWLGVDDATVYNIGGLGGSGTIDAIFLRNQRFYQVVPTFLNQVQISLNTPPTVNASWNTLQLHHQIDLNLLLGDDSACAGQIKVQAISPNSQMMAISGDRPSTTGSAPCSARATTTTLQLWNLQQGSRIATLLNPTSNAAANPTSAAFTPNSQQIAAGLSDGSLRLWNAATGAEVRRFLGHQAGVKAIAISPDGQRLISGSADQTIKVWNLRTGELLSTLALRSAGDPFQTFQLSPSGQRLAVATQSTVQLWDVSAGQRIQTLVNRDATAPQRALKMAFSPDGSTLAATDADYSIKLWNAGRGYRMITLRGHSQDGRAIAFSPDSQTLASSTDNSVLLWDLRTYQVRHSFVSASAGQTAPGLSAATWLAFSPDGQMLAAPAPVRTQRPNSLPSAEPELMPGAVLWQTQTQQQALELPQVSWLTFSPNNQFIVSQGTGASVQVWQR